jgi:DNA polymerase III delta prime subunit
VPLITSIKQVILQLNGGAFQVLCDDWLSRKIGGTICSLGSQAGTQKTTRGTPDSYFRTDDGHYIFVEYTTQTSKLVDKIKADLEKCLDESKTGVQCSEVRKIVYCHTSSNLSAKKDFELHKICSNVGVELELYGIDAIAADIVKSFPVLAKDHLGVPIDTGQILSINDYLKDHDSNKMMAPLGLAFHHREEELNQLLETIQDTNVVMLTGNPGVGKTRIAIELAKRYASENNANALVIHDRQLPLFDDIQALILNSCPYIIVVDDANQITQLNHILELLKRGNVKLIITVREYAMASVASQVRQFTNPEDVSIGNFTDDEIRKIVEDELGIKNGNYLKRIAEIADGNARLAVLAGKLAVEKNTLESIADASGLYEEYYGQILSQIKSDDDDKEMLVAGILAFFETIQESQIENLLAVLPGIGINKDAFLDCTKRLSEKEIMNIYHDRAFRIADQTFGNFIVKFAFVDKKVVPLSDVVKGGFAISKSRTINAINMLIKIFSTGDTHKYVDAQLKVVWEELKSSNSPDFLEYVKCAFAINPTEALLILKECVDSSKENPMRLTKGDFEEKRNGGVIDDDILEIIGGFLRQHLKVQSVTELFLQYFDKRPDLYGQFLIVIDQGFMININSIRFGYDVQIELLKAIRGKADSLDDNNAMLLFLEVARKLLQYTFRPTEAGRGNTITLYAIPLADSEGCRAYRSLIWSGLGELIRSPEYRDGALDVLLKLFSNYPQEDSEGVALFDAHHVNSLFCELLPDTLQHCVLASKFVRWVHHIEPSYDVTFLRAYMENPKYQMIKMLGRNDETFVGYEQQIEKRKKNIQPFIYEAGIAELAQLIDICAEYEPISENNAWDICVGLDVLLDALYEKDVSLFLDIVKVYMRKGTPLRLLSEKLICNLKNAIGDAELFSLLQNSNYPVKSSWLYLYFCTLSKDEVKQSHVDAWYSYIEDDALQSAGYRGLDFLANLSTVDKEIIPGTCDRLLHHKVNPERKVVDFCSDLLSTYSKSTDSILSTFSGHLELLKDIYLTIFRIEQNGSFDYEGKLFVALARSITGFLHEYVDTIVDHNIYCGMRETHFSLLYKNDDYLSIFDSLMEQAVSKAWFSDSLIESFVILASDSGMDSILRRNEWVLHFIEQNYGRIEVLRKLFPAVAKLGSDLRIQCINRFLELNDNPNDFDPYCFEPMHRSWSGSEVPLIDQDIQFYKELLSSMPSGLEYLAQRKKIEDVIEDRKKYKADVEIREMMARY